MSKFFNPLKEEFKWNPYGWLNLVASLGIIPVVYFSRYVDSLWICWGLFLLWYFLVYFTYLTYRYFRNK